MIFKNCTFYNEVFEKEFGDIKIENGKIAEIGYFNENGIDMTGKIILPGLVDIHIHNHHLLLSLLQILFLLFFVQCKLIAMYYLPHLKR